MSDTDNCPTQDELHGLNHGDLPGEQLESICDHIEYCARCQKRFSLLEELPDEIKPHLSDIGRDDLKSAAIAMEHQLRHEVTASKEDASPESEESSSKPSLNTPCQLRQYEVLRLIGTGGMGEVYEGRHKNLKRSVALKVIKGYRQDDPVAYHHFLREMETAGQLDHPNLVRAYDAWEKDGRLYIAQELLNGDSLQYFANNRLINSPKQIIVAMQGTARALKEIHARGFVHRDVKPANIMWLSDGAIKLIDYGLAVAYISTDSKTHRRAGTIGYMAPEQFGGDTPIDHRSDLYALGRVIEYLISVLPAKDRTTEDSKAIERLSNLSTQLSRSDPTDRIKNASQVIFELDQIDKAITSSCLPNKTQQLADAVSRHYVSEITECDSELPSHRRATWKRLLLLSAALTLFAVSAAAYYIFEKPRQATITEVANTSQPLPPSPPFELVAIPAGQFVMGFVEGDLRALAFEAPPRTIQIQNPFRMSSCEITVGQFREFTEATGYITEAESSGTGGWKHATASSYGSQQPEFNWKNPGYPVTESLPVTMVTYDDAIAFCEWLGQRDGVHYRLPTEAEWEYACRAGSETIFAFDINTPDTHVWYGSNSGGSPKPVGTKTPNAWGLWDMNGNVREWCLDWYDPRAYEATYEEFLAGPPDGDVRVTRGGCFINGEKTLRASTRQHVPPGTSLNTQGFRIVQGDLPELDSKTSPHH
jgi:formylglycine-generating enzyme required for sulfatase activity/tRNA A-37 threonylcarbamoyl transferase component Bud32